jgi:hypothetical protein
MGISTHTEERTHVRMEIPYSSSSRTIEVRIRKRRGSERVRTSDDRDIMRV